LGNNRNGRKETAYWNEYKKGKTKITP